jgi:hypothetical protein
MVFVLSSYDTQSAGADGAAIIGVYSSLEKARKKIETLGRLDYANSDSGLGNIEGDNGKGDEEGRIHYHVKDVQQGGRRRTRSTRSARKTRRRHK